MDPLIAFKNDRKKSLRELSKNKRLKKIGLDFLIEAEKSKYSYNFNWLGRPIIQYPQDMIAVQEIIWDVRPDLIIETGVAHGGSLILSASMLALLGGKREVIGIDIDVRKHNEVLIKKHPLGKKITLIQGSSISDETLAVVRKKAKGKKKILVILDSNHSHDHVLRELELYSPFVTKGSYVIVFDTVIEYMPKPSLKKRPWGKGNNPLTAARQFLRSNRRFATDHTIDAKLQLSVAPEGYLKRIR